MKKPSSGIGIGLWVTGGLVALYLLGALLIMLDGNVFRTMWLMEHCPSWLLQILVVLYEPFFDFLERLGF